MHKFAKQIMDCVKAHVDGIGIENFEGQNLDDLKDWTEIAKNIVCFDKDYNIVEAMSDAERMRDLDRMSHGKMYYSKPMSGDQMSTGTHDGREGRAGMSRRSYIETKELHHGDSTADKDAKMKALEKYMKSISEDVAELFSVMSPEEKQLAKTNLTMLVTKMQ